MTLSHYLPAAYLGGFSSERGVRRTRRVWVLRRGAPGPTLTRAQKLLRVRGLYEPSPVAPVDLERHWQRYERKLPFAIEMLVSGSVMDAGTWLHVLVPFVTGTLLRGPEFERRLRQRIAGIDPDLISQGNENGARLIESQRLFAPVMAAHWVVLSSPESELVSSDLGWVHASPYDGQNIGVGIVLDPRHVLMLVPEVARPVLTWEGSGWVTTIERGVIPGAEARGLNELQAHRADRLIVGSSPSVLAPLRSALNGPRIDAPEPLGAWGIDSWTLVVHEFEWWRLARAINRSPAEITDFELSFAIANDDDFWPAVVLPVNLPEFESGLSLDAEVISLRLNSQPRPFAP
jgi:hypothetical protein